MTIQERIIGIEGYRKEQENLIKKRTFLFEPSSKHSIESVYSTVNALYKDLDKSYEGKHYFIFVSILLFSPRAFAGECMGIGVRNRIAETLNLSPSYVSNIFKNVHDWYRIYKGFRDSVDYIYSEIMESDE